MQKMTKEERERKVLIGLIEHYIQTGKPVGSNTLKEAGFGELSSATIRNYFSKLEEEGFLTQQHASGGRVPTPHSFKFYAKEFYNESKLNSEDKERLRKIKQPEGREIANLLRESAQHLSDWTSCAVFLSAPRFDNDFLIDIKVVAIDVHRCLCILVTDFGLIQTELLYTDRKMSTFAAKRIENYFHWRLTGQNKPASLESEEEQLAQKFYNEVMVRFIAGYSNFSAEDIFTTGFSHLLIYPELREASTLTSTLGLFENAHSMRLLLRDCIKHNCLRYWIDDDLKLYTHSVPNCAVLLHPYNVGLAAVGAIGLLGPIRMPYRRLFAILRAFSDSISERLTKTVYKFKLSFRQASPISYLEPEKSLLIGESRRMLLQEKQEGE